MAKHETDELWNPPIKRPDCCVPAIIKKIDNWNKTISLYFICPKCNKNLGKAPYNFYTIREANET